MYLGPESRPLRPVLQGQTAPRVKKMSVVKTADDMGRAASSLGAHAGDRNLDVLGMAERWRADGRGVALATVVETWGSAPRPVGSHLAVDEEGNFEGSVSGGCVEGAVVGEALDVIGSGEPRMLEFGVADETAWRVGLSCGGRIRVYVERVD